MKQKRSIKKYAVEPSFTLTQASNQTHLSDIREQLRSTLQQLEQHKLSSELEGQKRLMAEQQCSMLKEQNMELRNEIDDVRRELAKYSKKISKLKEQRSCDKCKAEEEVKEKAEREREVFIKERNVLKKQISQLKSALQCRPQLDESRLMANIDSMRKELEIKNKTIQDQKKIIKYLDEKLSVFELQKMETLNYVEQVDQRIQQLQMQNYILKGNRNNHSPPRKNGSIKNLQRSRSRISKMSPTKY